MGSPSAFGGVPSTPFPISDCRIIPVAPRFRLTLHPSSCLGYLLVLFMSFRQCAFFYYSFFFSLDSPSLPFVFGVAHLYFFVRCGGVVCCLFGLFLALILFPTSFPFLELLLVSAGFFVCDLLCLFFLRALLLCPLVRDGVPLIPAYSYFSSSPVLSLRSFLLSFNFPHMLRITLARCTVYPSLVRFPLPLP